MQEKTEGLLLYATPYLGQQKIVKVFTPDAGLLSFMVKKKALFPFTHPFCHAEWVYKKGKEELHALQDASFLSDLSDLRLQLPTLTAAGLIASALLKTQLPSKSGGALYLLALSYLKRLPLFSHPLTLAASFRLKLLLHEGLLSLTPHCAHCAAPASSLVCGESFCLSHSPSGAPFSPAEWDALFTLTYAKRFRDLENSAPSPALQEKIHHIFTAQVG